MNASLFSLLKGKDPDRLTDVIELNDGRRIESIILSFDPDNIQFFTGRTSKPESLPASSIYMLYLDDATISIPFPVIEDDRLPV